VDPDELNALMRAGKKRAIYEVGDSTREVDHGIEAIERLLPHRDPFRFVDRISKVDLEQGALTAHRTIDADDPVFVGHFPDYPIYPGVLQLETMGQAGICLVHFMRHGTVEVAADAKPADVRAFKIHSTLFLDEVGPGHAVTIDARVISDDAMTAVCLGQLRREERICALAVMEVYFVDEE